jgi:hypothetical protein
MRERANRVQVETVIAAAPRLPHTPALNDGGVYASRPQGRSSRQAGGTSADNDNIIHSLRLIPGTLGVKIYPGTLGEGCRECFGDGARRAQEALVPALDTLDVAH